MRRKVFATLGSNYTLRDKKLFIDNDNLLFAIKKVHDVSAPIISTFEPPKNVCSAKQIEQLYAHSPRILRALDDLRTIAMAGDTVFARKLV